MIILPVPNTILFIKTFTILVVVKCLSLGGMVTLPAITMSKLHEMTPISVVYCLHAGLVLRALMRLSVPMYNTLKRLTPIMVLGSKVGSSLQGRSLVIPLHSVGMLQSLMHMVLNGWHLSPWVAEVILVNHTKLHCRLYIALLPPSITQEHVPSKHSVVRSQV